MDLHFYEKLIDYRNRQGMAPQIGAQMTKITEGHAWAELPVQMCIRDRRLFANSALTSS